MPFPLVTVVIPCLNQAHYLGAALASVRAQLYAPIETIVVDDGSTDDTAWVAASAGVTVIRQANSGLSGARNRGLAAASGKYVVFLDADDELLPDAVSSGVDLLERFGEVALLARCCVLIDARGHELPTFCPPPSNDDLYGEWLERNFVWTPGAAVFRRDVLVEMGGFPGDVGAAGDYAVYLDMARHGRARFDARDAVRYRQHESNMSRDAAHMLRATLAVLRRESPRVTARHRARFRRGLRAWRTFYGEQIIQQLRSDVRARRLGRRQLQDVMLLARECRSLMLRHAFRKLSRVVRGLPRTEVEPGRFTPTEAESRAAEIR
jgi:glycosyltransferase involved in cell wall biosynthesis